jgi:energy-coupling factor transporter ATP-binding protein EcfA2
MLKLLQLDISNHPILGTTGYPFFDLEKDKPIVTDYVTVILGINGTGKSTLMKFVSDILISLNVCVRSKQSKSLLDNTPFKFFITDLPFFKIDFDLYYSHDNAIIKIEGRSLEEIKYKADESKHSIRIFEGRFLEKGLETEYNDLDDKFNSFYLKKVQFESLSDLGSLIIPNNVISAFSFNERYTIGTQNRYKDTSYYKYLGIKSTTNNIFINNPSKELSDRILEFVIDNERPELFTFLSDMKYEPIVNFKYLISQKSRESLVAYMMAGKESKDRMGLFKNYFIPVKSQRYNLEKRQSYFNPEHPQYATRSECLDIFIKLLFDPQDKSDVLNRYLDFGQRELSFPLDLTISVSNYKYFKEIIKVLLDFELIKYDSLGFSNKHTKSVVGYNQFSSGEFHLVHTLFNIIISLRENTIYLIDEPEISLHPAWQQRFIGYIQLIQKSAKGTHFIIASHSHFIVSDLKDKNTCVVVLENVEQNQKTYIKAELLKKSTYAWNAEKILFEVFKSPGYSNFSILKSIENFNTIVSEISDDNIDLGKIKQLEGIVQELELIKDLKKDDPLTVIINSIRSFSNK